MIVTTKNQLRKYFKSVISAKSPNGEFTAWLGNADGTVVADDRGGVYIMDWNGNVQVVLNTKVPAYPFRPVRVGYVSESSKVLEVKEFVDAYPTRRPIHVPNHAENHQWGGVDTIWVRGEQILPGNAIPDDTDQMVINFVGYVYFLNGWHLIDTFALDLTPYIPSTGALYILLEVDEDRVVTVLTGSAVGSREELEYEDIPSPSAGKRPLVAVKMYAGQTRIWKTKTMQDIVDLRWAGFSTGGISTAVNWSEIIDIPAVFPPDTSYTDPLYVRKFIFSTPPTVDDDDTEGYLKTDLWFDEASDVVYQCHDNATGAADWQVIGGGGGGDLEFRIDGTLAVLSDVYYILITKDTTISKWYIFCDSPGSAGSTIYDVHLNGTTIFTDQGNRPTLAYNDGDGWAVSGTPDFVDFVEGDILSIHIDQVATGAEGLSGSGLVTGSGGGGNFNLTLEDESATVSVPNVGKIVVPDGTLQNNGGGEVQILSAPYVLLQDQKTQNTDGGTFTSGAWQTRTINTEVSDTGGVCSIASNQITLAAGTYEYEISAPGFLVNSHQAKLYNVTDAADVAFGTSEYSGTGSFATSRSVIKGRMTISASKVFEIRHRCGSTKATNGFGEKSNVAVEIYTIAEFRKVA